LVQATFFFKGFLKSKWLEEKKLQNYVFFTNCIYAGNLGLIQACAKARNFFLILFQCRLETNLISSLDMITLIKTKLQVKDQLSFEAWEQ